MGCRRPLLHRLFRTTPPPALPDLVLNLPPLFFFFFGRDPGAAIPIFSYQSLNSLPRLQQLHSHSPHGLLKQSSAAAAAAAGGAADSRGGGGVAKADEGGGVVFEGLYQEPSLGHLVGLVRYYVHQMETVSKEEVSVRPVSKRCLSNLRC